MRDCKNCKHLTSSGCEVWECEFEKIDGQNEKIIVWTKNRFDGYYHRNAKHFYDPETNLFHVCENGKQTIYPINEITSIEIWDTNGVEEQKGENK